MKVIIYAGGQYMTGDDIAAALLEYSRALAEEDTAATVEIPILDEDGSRASATFLVGPASQIVAVSVDSAFEELIAPEVGVRLRQLTAALRPTAGTETADGTASWGHHEF